MAYTATVRYVPFVFNIVRVGGGERTKELREMGSSETKAALATMQAWNWERWDYDNCRTESRTRSLSEAVNKLALDGHHGAAGAMLALLAEGKIVAFGSYSWRSFRGEHYQDEGYGDIPARRWLALQEGLALPWGNDWRGPHISLSLIGSGNGEYPVANWNWNDNRFSTAHRADTDLLFTDGYFEETFAAQNIEVLPAPAGDATLEALPAPETLTIERPRGRKRQYDWEGAMAYVVAVANTPDGIETGHGGQAAIERMIAEYFERTRDDGSAPCESEIRKRASRVMQAIETLKLSLSKAA